MYKSSQPPETIPTPTNLCATQFHEYKLSKRITTLRKRHKSERNSRPPEFSRGTERTIICTLDAHVPGESIHLFFLFLFLSAVTRKRGYTSRQGGSKAEHQPHSIDPERSKPSSRPSKLGTFDSPQTRGTNVTVTPAARTASHGSEMLEDRKTKSCTPFSTYQRGTNQHPAAKNKIKD